MLGTDNEPAVVEPTPPTMKPLEEMTDRELLEECILNQRVMVRQFSEIVTAFSDIQQHITAGGIGGLMKAFMGRG